ncbi:MAG: 4-(cytidine 5'-diphospho)-2-C-methyl-D-erythritol kinase [Acidimicrobiia bacterium]
MKAVAHAKLNLSLRVVGRRINGLHEISSVMCSLDLGDAVRVELAEGRVNTLEVSGEDTGPDLQNLALKAAKVFQDACAITDLGFEIKLEKRVPPGTGLGGGSADAAAVLDLANRISGANLDGVKLAEIGRSVGSDVPFCLVGGVARVGSTGEKIETLEFTDALEAARFVVGIPDFWLSTGDVYAAFDSIQKKGEQAEPPAAIDGLVDVFVNDLEPAAEWLAPPLEKLRRKLSRIAGSPARMTGSGSAMFVVCDSEDQAMETCNAAQELFSKVFVCRASRTGVTIVERGSSEGDPPH